MKTFLLFYILLATPKVFMRKHNGKILSQSNLAANYSDTMDGSIPSDMNQFSSDNKGNENFIKYIKYNPKKTFKSAVGRQISNKTTTDNGINVVNRANDLDENDLDANETERNDMFREGGAGGDDNKHTKTIATFDDHYYDWNFKFGKIAPGVAVPDAKAEAITTTDISCWDCDEEHGESPLLVRCDYTLVFNATTNPRGFACVKYEVYINESLKPKTFNKAKCVMAPSTTSDPCEEIVRNVMLPKRIQNCKICWNDACNAACFEKDISMFIFYAILAGLLLCCCFTICLLCGSKTLCCSC